MKAYCHKCGALVAEIVEGSRIRRGTIYTCAKCDRSAGGVSEFMREIFGGKK